MIKDWWIYQGTHQPHTGIQRLPAPPPWRKFESNGPIQETRFESSPPDERLLKKSVGFQVDDEEIDLVNAALYLRRPLLVTGKPGSGKSTLAYAVAYELQLGPVLYWPITTKTTLQNGLYAYDAIGRLQDASLLSSSSPEIPNIGNYLRLGPLGTALLPNKYPRVLLIDEIDKSNMDLPNDLLTLFEEGEYEIPELARLTELEALVHTTDDQVTRIKRGIVQCSAFPIIILTSNGEREFPPAFLRRCLRLDMKQPDENKLARIVEARLGAESLLHAQRLIKKFVQQRATGDQATDQLLNAIYLLMQSDIGKEEELKLLQSILRPLTDEDIDGN